MRKFWVTTLTLMFFAVPFVACDVDKVQDGEMPEVDVEGGELPEYDVDPAEVEVEMEKKEVVVPEVDVNMPDEDPVEEDIEEQMEEELEEVNPPQR